MDISAANIAVASALSGKWSEAIDANLEIIRSDPDDTEALCRLARAYSEIGKIHEARDTANKVLGIDPTNQIATKFLEKLKLVKKSDGQTFFPTRNESFLEEPGKTKLIQLLNLGEPVNFINLDPGEEVKLTCYSHRVSITTLGGVYIGRLPDDVAARLRNLIKKGNKYQALIKSVNLKEITIFVRELERGAKVAESPSFSPEKIEYVSFTPPELVHSDIPDVQTTEETPEE